MPPLSRLMFLLPLAALSCGSPNKPGRERAGKAGSLHGGILRTAELFNIRSLYPPDIIDLYSRHIAAQVYEGLVRYDMSDLSIVPALAERWEVNDSATVFVFHIRQGVFFHYDPCFPDGQGREVTAYDFQFAFNKLCTEDKNNHGFWIFRDRVQGASAFYQSTVDRHPIDGGVSGIRVIDDYTLQIKLNYPFAGFLHALASPNAFLYPREAYRQYGEQMRTKCVGTGPFRIAEFHEGNYIRLKRNDDYWRTGDDGMSLPYLDEVHVQYITGEELAFQEFSNGDLDLLIGYPAALERRVREDVAQKRFVLDEVPALSVFYFGFLHSRPPFNKAAVRRAFNLAVDKEMIVRRIVRGGYMHGKYGIVSPAITGYDAEQLRGYPYDPDRARGLLAEAGYPDGKGFPAVTLATMQEVRPEAEAVQKMLRDNLGVNIQVAVMPFGALAEQAYSGRLSMFRYGWLADYPDPENFLNILYGATVPEGPDGYSPANPMRYRSATFDSLFLLARKENDVKKRYDLLRKADQVSIDDAAILPLNYGKTSLLLQNNVKGCPANAMALRDFSTVYFERKK